MSNAGCIANVSKQAMSNARSIIGKNNVEKCHPFIFYTRWYYTQEYKKKIKGVMGNGKNFVKL